MMQRPIDLRIGMTPEAPARFFLQPAGLWWPAACSTQEEGHYR